MRIVTYKAITNFCVKHKDAETALQDWYSKTMEANWTCYADMKNSFNTVDSVGNKRFVFNIKGNDYRLVAIVLFNIKMVYIRFIGTHKEYDKIDCSKI
ncbi:MAG: type II toxin-antitoxin system HigB family toxin [Paludibacter sp.]